MITRFQRNVVAVAVALTACDDAATAPTVRIPLADRSATHAVAANQPGVLQIIEAFVQDLVSAGDLTEGQANALLVKLRAATGPAGSGSLGAFLNQVSALVQAGTLSTAQGAQLASLGRSVTDPTLDFASISAGGKHACGRTPGGLAYCWGDNTFGQLGNGSTAASLRAVLVSASTTFAWIGAGDAFTCALTAAGEAWCWGGNRAGELGDGSTTDRAVPGRVAGGYTFASLDVGTYNACGVTTTGVAVCWGPGGRFGVDIGGLGTPAPSTCPGYFGAAWPCATAPVPVSGGYTFAQVTAGLFGGCGLVANGQPLCWGWNIFLQLGNGTNVDAPVPTPVATNVALASISRGAAHTCGLDAVGSAYCWGGAAFNWGQLGDGTLNPAPVPRPVALGFALRSIRPSKGNNIFVFTCGVTTGDIALCWGANDHGQLGAAAPLACNSGGPFSCSALPLQVSGGLAFQDVSTGSALACGVTKSNQGYCWGWNFWGQIGNGTTTDALAPARVIQ
jgi:alpha-tubulin suppressor-like RCC1 family protein